VAAVLAALVRNGKEVLVPFGDAQRYDLVTLDGANAVRIQVKKGRLCRGRTVLRFDTCSQSRNCPRRDYRGDADLFAVYCVELDKVYVIPVIDAPIAGCQLRLAPSKNNQRDGIRWAKDFELGS